MKQTKTLLVLLLSGTVTFTVGLWFYSTMEALTIKEYTVATAVAIIVLFSVIIAFKRLKAQKQGLAVDDELSELIKQKAAAKAFTFSFYIWMFIVIFTSDQNFNDGITIGIGVLAMGLLFIIFWIYYSKMGIDEQKNIE